MTKQEIFELHDSCIYYNRCFGIIYNKDEFVEKLLAKFEQEKNEVINQAKLEQINACAEEWKSEIKLFEQEKKEQAREIFEKIYNEVEYYSLGQVAIKQLAKEYGVEL